MANSPFESISISYLIINAQAAIANNAQPSTNADVKIIFVMILLDASG